MLYKFIEVYITVTFGEKVKYVRGELQLSQTQLAREIGVSFATVNRWETHNIEPQYLTQIKFEKFCYQNRIKIKSL